MLSRVGDVRLSRDCLRSLLDAVVASISSRLDLRMTLRRITEAACDLVDARYGAFAVLGAPGQPVHLVTYATDGSAHPGFDSPPAAGGPAAGGILPVLGVPVWVGGALYGNLYLGEKRGGAGFTDDDEEVLVALAAAAGVAIENARLYAAASRRERWLAATAEITSLLLGTVRRTDALTLVARRAREVAEAEWAIVLLYDEDGGQFTVEVADHPGGVVAGLTGAVLPAAGTAVADVVISRRQVVVEDLGRAAPWPVPVGSCPAVVSPLAAGDTLHGVLVVARAADAAAQPPEDLPLLASFAAQAALAMERVRAQEERELLAVLEDRGRIARDLHDVVIQRLFATGLQLQSAGLLAARTVRQRIDAAVDDLDATIRDIRRTIFELRRPPCGALRGELYEIIRAAAASLGFAPRIEIRGPVDSAVPDAVRADLLAVLQEALSNVTRHAGCGAVEVVVEVADRVSLTVTDDGVGIDPADARSGLVNLAERADRHGGGFVVARTRPRGTRLYWWTPLHACVAAAAAR
nr:GAF domain-containing protein [Pilimelia terevasa]